MFFLKSPLIIFNVFNVSVNASKCNGQLTYSCYCLLLQQEKFIVMENYQAQSSEEMTVYKNDVVFFVSKHKRDPQLFNVRSFSRERSGHVPVAILKKLSEGEEIRKNKFGGKIFKLVICWRSRMTQANSLHIKLQRIALVFSVIFFLFFWPRCD